MKNLEPKEFAYKYKINEPKTQALVEEVLGKIREIESREERTKTSIIDSIKQDFCEIKIDKKANKRKIEYDTHHYHNKELTNLIETAEKIQEQIKGLAALVSNKRPDLNQDEQDAIVKELFDFNSDKEDFKIREEINVLKILLMDQEFFIQSGDPKANPARAASLRAQIASLASQL